MTHALLDPDAEPIFSATDIDRLAALKALEQNEGALAAASWELQEDKELIPASRPGQNTSPLFTAAGSWL